MFYNTENIKLLLTGIFVLAISVFLRAESDEVFYENTYINIKNSTISICREQKQPVFISATKCGILNSFSSNSPPPT